MKWIELWYIVRAVWAARRVQDFLWHDSDGAWGMEEWRRAIRKRVVKIDEISPDNPHWYIEMRKRLLQNAALSIALMAHLDENYKIDREKSAMEAYKEKLQSAIQDYKDKRQ